MMALVMSQLQPILQSFNYSLEHLSQQVGALVQDVAELKSRAELGAEQVGGAEFLEARDRREEEEKEQGVLGDRLEEVLAQVKDVRLQVEEQRSQLEERLHSQHAMLHYNLTAFKMDMDVKLKRNQKMLQVRERKTWGGGFSITSWISTDLLTSYPRPACRQSTPPWRN